MSPYNYAAGNPINIFDPNGDVNIFFNGQHFGSGGKKEYWGEFADDVMTHNGDQNAVFLEGAMGGFTNTIIGGLIELFTGAPVCNLDIEAREKYGRQLAREFGPMILERLEDGESIKIFDHSMGGAPAKTFIDELMTLPLFKEKNVVIEYEAGFATFEPGKQFARKDVPTFQRSHYNDGVANFWGDNATIKGAWSIYTRPNGELGPLGEHGINSFRNEIEDAVPKSTMNPTGTPYIFEQNGEKENGN